MRCVPGCTRTFSSERSLGLHQHTCQVYKRYNANIRARARSRLSAQSQPIQEAQAESPSDTQSPRNDAPAPLDEAPPVDYSPTPCTTHGRPIRSNRGRLPARFLDILPEAPPPLPPPVTPHSSSPALPDTPDEQPRSLPLKITRTNLNTFRLLREYYGDLPVRDPDNNLEIQDLAAEGPPVLDEGSPDSRSPEDTNPYAPYPNSSAFLLHKWQWTTGAIKSRINFKKLVDDVLLAKDFSVRDLHDISWDKLDGLMGDNGDRAPFDARDGWNLDSVPISIPSGQKGVPPAVFNVAGLHHRSLISVLRTACESDAAKSFHFVPYRLIHQPLGAPEQIVHGELYNSPVWIDEHIKLQQSPPEPGCTLPRAIIAMMGWSDSTHLTSYGDESLWPVYTQLGNQTKYARAKPNARAFHHVAYIPKLPEILQDFIRRFTGKPATPVLLAHLKRELIHAIWKLLLDDEFCDAYAHGIIVTCGDGTVWRLYPRFFTYSADYPEKVLLATIRDMGGCPCPRCFIPKRDIPKMGQKLDLRYRVTRARVDNERRRSKVSSAHKAIYEHGYAVNSKAVEDLLKPESLVPTENAFSARLGDWMENFHDLFVIDCMHEWDLGNWKRILAHILRILHLLGRDVVQQFNERFRNVPAFGTDKIRAFNGNVADMKQFAARDFEDVLQCIIPVIEGLVPSPHNETLLDLLFTTCWLHGLSRLRMHTDSTLTVLDSLTVEFGRLLRMFADDTCPEFATAELPREAAARYRREAKKASEKAATVQAEQHPQPSGPPTTTTSREPPIVPPTITVSGPQVPRKPKEFTLETYKLHSLGDYGSTIRKYGTTDSYSTQPGEHEHRVSKARLLRVSMNGYTAQLASIERREARIHQIAERVEGNSNLNSTSPQDVDVDPDEMEPVPLSEHHFIGRSNRHYVHIGSWLREHIQDPATKDFIPRLKDHLLARIQGHPHSGDEIVYSSSEHDNIIFKNDRIFIHKIFRLHYTTYDVRRDRDIINPSGPRCDIMLPADEDSSNPDSHPFWYARVLGIHHVEVQVKSGSRFEPPRRMDFLFVRWFGREPGWKSGWKAKRLDRIGFVPVTDGAFGFVDPSTVLRGCHLIPAFSQGKTSILLGPSQISRHDFHKTEDWTNFYVNRFVDRDMIMRYMGGGIGHMQTIIAPMNLSTLEPDNEENPDSENLLDGATNDAVIDYDNPLGQEIVAELDGDPGHGEEDDLSGSDEEEDTIGNGTYATHCT